MIPKAVFFVLGLVFMPGVADAASCSRINLTKCLDSACAINISSNPAARCQYCGTADAGEPASVMKSISTSTQSKNTISDKELKQAPTDPGERYVWATKLCLSKVQNCTSDDVDEAYDPLIEKSCQAAGVASNFATLQKQSITSKRNETNCTNDVVKCITANDRCTADYSKCSDDALFDNFIATCITQATGCTDFATKVRTTIANNRTKSIQSISENINAVASAHQQAREKKLSSIQSDCKNDTGYEKCVKSACMNNTNTNCSTQSDQSIANSLCQYHKTACTKIK